MINNHTDVAIIKFDFDLILSNIRSKHWYLQFLKEIKCEESLLFLDQVSIFESLRSSLNRYRQALHIIDTFIVDDSQYQLNLDSTSKNEILSKLNIITQDCPKDLFIKVSNLIAITLKEDTFNRFIQSKTFTSNLIKEIKTDYNFLSKISIDSSINRISSSDQDVVKQVCRVISDICEASSNSAIYVNNS